MSDPLVRCHVLRRRAFRQGWQACLEAVLEHLAEEAQGSFDPHRSIQARNLGDELRELYDLFPAGDL